MLILEMLFWKKCSKNVKVASHDIQNEIVHVAASETMKALSNDLRDDYFAILIDESRDVSFDK